VGNIVYVLGYRTIGPYTISVQVYQALDTINAVDSTNNARITNYLILYNAVGMTDVQVKT
jgi:hypothetical protein